MFIWKQLKKKIATNNFLEPNPVLRFHVSDCFSRFCPTDETFSNNNNNNPKIHFDQQLCSKGQSGFYSGIQHKYWKVGLFEYYTLNNIPNFLAGPYTIIFIFLFWIQNVFYLSLHPQSRYFFKNYLVFRTAWGRYCCWREWIPLPFSKKFNFLKEPTKNIYFLSY